MATTVIDALIVTLGLDASKYKQGRETAEKETSETARKTKASADSITKSLTEVGRTISGLFLGFESVTGFTKFLGNLNAGEAALGRTATNIHMSAHELNKWGRAVELAGGSATDAQSAFVQFTDEAQKFFVTGQASPLINTLLQYGVSLKNAKGEMRDQGEVFEELADKTAVYGAAYQNFALKQAGLTQGYINYLVQTKQARQDDLIIAERGNTVTDDTVKKAQELQNYWRNIGQQIESAGQMILTAITPTMEQILKIFGDVNLQSDEFTTGLKLVASLALGIKFAFATIGDTVGAVTAAINAAAHGNFKEAGSILADGFRNASQREGDLYAGADAIWNGSAASGANALGGASGDWDDDKPTYRNHNPGNLRPFKSGQPTDARGFRTFGSDAEGEKALEDDLRAKITKDNLNTIAKVLTKYAPDSENDTAGYIAAVSKSLHKGANATLTEADIHMLAQAITMREGAQVRTAGGAAGNSNTTTVSVEKIEVHSASADPRAVADQVGGAIQRKVTISQSDTGQS